MDHFWSILLHNRGHDPCDMLESPLFRPEICHFKCSKRGNPASSTSGPWSGSEVRNHHPGDPVWRSVAPCRVIVEGVFRPFRVMTCGSAIMHTESPLRSPIVLVLVWCYSTPRGPGSQMVDPGTPDIIISACPKWPLWTISDPFEPFPTHKWSK